MERNSFIARDARKGDYIQILKHDSPECIGERQVHDIIDDTVYFYVDVPADFSDKGYEILKYSTPLDRFKQYNGKPAYWVLRK